MNEAKQGFVTKEVKGQRSAPQIYLRSVQIKVERVLQGLVVHMLIRIRHL